MIDPNLEVKQNFKKFQEILPDILREHNGQFAVMQNMEIVEFMDTFEDALKYAYKVFGSDAFSIQHVIDPNTLFLR